MKTYALVSENYIRFVDLRETAKYLINDINGEKYKKCVGENYIASNLKFRNWSWSGNNVYEIDHPIVSETREKILKEKFLRSVQMKMREYKIESYDDAKRIREFFNFDI